MKKIYTIIALTIMTLLFCAASYGQNRNPGRGWESRMKAEKIAFLTQELDLSPEEAQVFWPVYNQYWKESLTLHKEMMDAFGEFRGKKADEISESELDKKVEAYIQASKASNQVMADWYPKFKKVLPIRKVAKLYQAEEAFQMRMINNLRKHPGQNPPQGSVFRDRDKDKK